MQYRVIRTENLEHSLFSKAGAKLGSTWEKHKYIAKQKAGDGYRYFYSQAELAAAKAKQAGQKVSQTAKSAASKVSGVARSGIATVKRTASNAASDFKQHVSKVRNYHNDINNRINSAANGSMKGQTLSKGSSARAVIDALTSSPDYKYSQALDTFLSNAEGAISKGKTAVSKIISGTKEVSSTAIDKGKAFCKKAGLAVSDKVTDIKDFAKQAVQSTKSTAGNIVKEAGKQVDLAKNAVDEAKWERALKNSINTQQNKLDDIDKKISNYHKKADKDPEYAENNAGYIEALTKERDSVSKELARVRNQYIDWTNGDKYWYELTPGSSKTKKVTSTERKDRIKNR